MKKVLLIFILTLFFVPNVRADECNLLASYSSDDYHFVEGAFGNYYLYKKDNSSYARLAFNKDFYYTVYFDNADTINLSDYEFNFSGNNNLYFTKSNYYYQFTSSSNYNAQIFTKSILNDWNNLFIYSSNIDILCLPTESSEEPIIPDTTLDDFYSIYTSKLTLLSNYVVENKFLFSWIGIILLFCILEIILKLLNLKGGKY